MYFLLKGQNKDFFFSIIGGSIENKKEANHNFKMFTKQSHLNFCNRTLVTQFKLPNVELSVQH